jgi:acetyl-CoA carboxylase carboxyltransferase component
VHYNKIQEIPAGAERDAFVQKLRDEYREDVSLEKLAAELVVDAVVSFDGLRGEIARRFKLSRGQVSPRVPRKHLVPPM